MKNYSTLLSSLKENTRTWLVTGCAGFIGFHLCRKLIEEEYKVIGIDNINSYYDKKLKKKRLEILSQTSVNKNNWKFFKIDLIEKNLLSQIFEKYKPAIVINLAAQAGVRYSLENPEAYIIRISMAFLIFWNVVNPLESKVFYTPAAVQFTGVIQKFLILKMTRSITQ